MLPGQTGLCVSFGGPCRVGRALCSEGHRSPCSRECVRQEALGVVGRVPAPHDSQEFSA